MCFIMEILNSIFCTIFAIIEMFNFLSYTKPSFVPKFVFVWSSEKNVLINVHKIKVTMKTICSFIVHNMIIKLRTNFNLSQRN